ncbi:MAG: hypothetical protein ACRC46_09590 [Thermoguttaceae bacterium]
MSDRLFSSMSRRRHSPSSVRRRGWVYRLYQRIRFGQTFLFAGLFLTGALILTVHLITWVIPQWREPTGSVWGWYFLVSVPLPLLVFGGLGLWWALRDRQHSQEFQSASKTRSPNTNYPTVPSYETVNDSPGTYLAWRLPLRSQPGIKLLGLATFTVFWNTISWWVLVYLILQPRTTSHLVACSLFGVLFCGTGLALFVWIVHQLLLAFGIGPTILEISDHPIVPNRSYRLRLVQAGVLRVRRLELAMTCCEVTRFRQGTDTITSTREVYHQTLYECEDVEIGRAAPMQHDMTLKLPLGVMHSMQCEHNEIVWRLVVVVEPAGSSPVVRDCPMVVLPAVFEEDGDP